MASISARYSLVKGSQGSIVPSQLSGLSAWMMNPSANFSGGTWADSSNNSNSLSTGSGSTGLTIQTNIYNGNSAVRFNGTSDWMSFGANFSAILGGSTYTLFLVIAPLVEDTTEHAIFRLNTSGGSLLRYGYINYDVPTTTPLFGMGYRTDTATLSYPAAGRATEDIATLFEIYQSGTTIEKVVKSSAVDSTDNRTNAGTATPSGSGQFGRSSGTFPERYINMDLAEVLLYNRSLNTAEREIVRHYLNNKFAIRL